MAVAWEALCMIALSDKVFLSPSLTV